MNKKHDTPASQKLTQEQFEQLAREELAKTGICSEKEIDAIIGLTLQLERGGMHDSIQEM